jgi:glycosyltransferase involved in cell wall biosynthesis
VLAITPVVAVAVAAQTGAVAHVVPHSVPEVFFAAGARRVRRDTGPLKLLFVGEVSDKKGIESLLRLMAGRDPAEMTLTVVGDGPLARRVAGLTGGPITYLGPILDRERLAGVMAGHDVLMLLSRRTPTWEEVFGIVIIEALAAGLAVIASNHLGPRTVLADHDLGGLFAQDDHPGVRGLVEDLARHRSRLHDLAARQRPACAAFSSAQVAERWLAVIHSMHGGKVSCGEGSGGEVSGGEVSGTAAFGRAISGAAISGRTAG